MAGFLTRRIIQECGNFVSGHFASRWLPGVVPVNADQFHQIGKVVPCREQAQTARLDLDIDRLKKEAAENLEEVHVTINRRLATLCRDLEQFFTDKLAGGERLLFTLPVQLHLAHGTLRLTAFLWMDYREVQPRSQLCPTTNPAPSPVAASPISTSSLTAPSK